LNTISQKLITKQTIGAFTLINIAYIASYTLVAGFLAPLQSLIFPSFTTTISLLFLPHGIRILSAYYYGWKSFFILLPSTYFMWMISVYGFGIPLHPMQPVLSGISCVLGVKIISKRFNYNLNKDMFFIIFAGLIGSLLNGLLNSWFMNNMFLTIQILGYVFGDVLGLIALTFLFSQTLKFINSFK
tara:strand:- start:128 stop:685 length:558 start_codon:yes stop_codon:yes gene_type:complete